MKFRSRFFGVLFILSIAWIMYGLAATSSAVSDVVSTPVATTAYLSATEAATARNVGVAIGAGIGLTAFMCTGLPATLLFGLLAWRNSAGLRAKRRHEELLEFERQKLAIMRNQRQGQ